MEKLDISVTFGVSATKTDPEEVRLETGEPADFDRFEHLASKLVQVPKSELDEKLKES